MGVLNETQVRCRACGYPIHHQYSAGSLADFYERLDGSVTVFFRKKASGPWVHIGKKGGWRHRAVPPEGA